MVVSLGLPGCQPAPTTRVTRGSITDVTPRDIAHAESIVLLADNGELMRFKVADSVRFAPGHLREHMLFAEPVSVTYVDGPDGPLAIEITD